MRDLHEVRDDLLLIAGPTRTAGVAIPWPMTYIFEACDAADLRTRSRKLSDASDDLNASASDLRELADDLEDLAADCQRLADADHEQAAHVIASSQA